MIGVDLHDSFDKRIVDARGMYQAENSNRVSIAVVMKECRNR